jgi:hypothetical protein
LFSPFWMVLKSIYSFHYLWLTIDRLTCFLFFFIMPSLALYSVIYTRKKCFPCNTRIYNGSTGDICYYSHSHTHKNWFLWNHTLLPWKIFLWLLFEHFANSFVGDRQIWMQFVKSFNHLKMENWISIYYFVQVNTKIFFQLWVSEACK